MWIYEKKLEFPVKITKPDARLAKIMIEQYGGADGELGASLRYLSQKFTMVTPEAKATLNDIATEEFAHLEMMGTIVHQLTQGLTKDEILAAGLDPYYVNHGLGVWFRIPLLRRGCSLHCCVSAIQGRPHYRFV